MIASLAAQMVQGPLEHPEFETALLVDPVTPNGRPGRYATQAVVITSVARRIIELSKAGDKLKSVVVQGAEDADPMANLEFRAISENLRELVDKWYPKAQLILLSSGLNLDDVERRHSISCYHHPIFFFEAGTQKTFGALTGQDPQLYKSVVENLQKFDIDRWILRARFVTGAVDNSTDSEFRNWLGYVEKFGPGHIQITTLAKPNAAKKLKPVAKARMTEIAEKTAAKTGIEVEILEGS